MIRVYHDPLPSFSKSRDPALMVCRDGVLFFSLLFRNLRAWNYHGVFKACVKDDPIFA